jgi:KUP system potassium uptake protein
MRVDYTSREIKSQIYLGAVNWSLMVAVIFIMLVFRKSENLAAAYGMAVTGSMTITGIMMIIVFAHTTKKWRALVALAITVIDAAYLFSTFSKIPHGAYWSIVLASIPFVTIIIWTRGQRSLYHALKPLDLETFLLSYEQIYAKGPIRGTGLFFTRETDVVPPYVVHCIIRSNIIYERNVFISLLITDEPLGVETELIKGIGPGLDAFRIEAGYMEVVDIETHLKANGIQEKVIFYGVEDIATRNPIWRVFSVFKKLTPNFVQFHKLPASRLQGVVTRVEM